MVEHHAPRYEALSKPQTSLHKRSFVLSSAELDTLVSLHDSLYQTLAHVNALLSSPRQLRDTITNQALLEVFSELPAPYFPFDSRQATFLTTEIIMSQDDGQPRIVSIDAHTGRRLDDLCRLNSIGFGLFSRKEEVIRTLQNHFKEQEMVMVRNSSDRIKYPHLSQALVHAGVPVLHQSSRETEENVSEQWQCILEMPFMQVRGKRRKRLHTNASFFIEPMAHLSGQRMLALLSHPECVGAFSSLKGIDRLSHSIPRTYLMDAEDIPPDAVLKSSAPLASQRCLGSYGSFPSIELRRLSRNLVAQERVRPRTISLPTSHTPCPVHLFLISYRGKLLAGMGVARVPANGIPAHDALLSIEIC
jgi:hypothetical protein